MRKSSKVFVGMDVHKESIDITVAVTGGEVRRWGQIGGDRVALEKAARDIAWKAQLRLCPRFRKLCAWRLNKNKVVVAIARELAGFVWAMAKDVKLD